MKRDKPIVVHVSGFDAFSDRAFNVRQEFPAGSDRAKIAEKLSKDVEVRSFNFVDEH